MKKKYIMIPIMILLFIVTVFRESLITYFNPLFKYAGQKNIMRSIKDYNTLETEHFIIRYKYEDTDEAIVTSKISEKYYANVTDMYGYKPDGKVQVIIYSSGEEMMNNTNLNEEVPPIGVYYSGVIHILDPKEWINDKENLNYIYEKEGPIVHEFAHLIIDDITKGNYPMWLTEGLALYTEYRLTGFEIREPLTEEETVPMKSLYNDFQDLNQEVAYRESFDIVKEISDELGFDRINGILHTLGEGKKANKTIESVLKMQKDKLVY